MSEKAFDEFGERLVLHCRDYAVGSGNLTLKPDYSGVDGKRWRAAAEAASGIVPAMLVVPELVDATLCAVLYEIDSQERIPLSFTTSRSETVDLRIEGGGELAGWYVGSGEWRPKYSKERFVDDFADIPSEWGVHTPELAPNLDDFPMPRRAIEELGILLVRHVRDVAIRSCDEQLLPQCQTRMAQRWRRAAIPFQGRVPPEVVIPDCVDETIVTFLRAIDQGLLPLSYTAENGDCIDLVKEGRAELAAKYLAPDGWRARFSKERFTDDAGALVVPLDP